MGQEALRDYILVLCSHCCSLSSYSEDFQKLDEVTELADEIYKWKYGKATKQIDVSPLPLHNLDAANHACQIIRVLKYFCCFP